MYENIMTYISNKNQMRKYHVKYIK